MYKHMDYNPMAVLTMRIDDSLKKKMDSIGVKLQEKRSKKSRTLGAS